MIETSQMACACLMEKETVGCVRHQSSVRSVPVEVSVVGLNKVEISLPLKGPPLPLQHNYLTLFIQIAKPAGVTSHWGMQCRWVSGCKQCLKGSGPVARTMPSQLRAGVFPLRPQHRLGAAPSNKKKAQKYEYNTGC